MRKMIKHPTKRNSSSVTASNFTKGVAFLLLLLKLCHNTVAAFGSTSSTCRRDGTILLRRGNSPSALGMSTSSSGSVIHKDVLIVGAGLAGLSAALHIATTSSFKNKQVTVVDSMAQKDISNTAKNVAGSFAAAGMLAPQSERLLPGPYLDLCLQSRSMYPNFISNVESLAQDYHSSWETSSSESNYLFQNAESNTLKPWEVGFLAAGGFIAPAFAGDSVETWAPPEGSGSARWLDASQVHELEPQLHPAVVGGWWFPEDASVDARRLTCSLRAACVAAGVHFQLGPNFGVSSLDLQEGRCSGVKLANGKIYTANSILIANGSWMRNLLPVPVVPHKGQSLSLRMDPNQPPLLNRVLFAQDTYIVPKADGRIILGATVEPGVFDPAVTPSGIMHVLSNAIRLVPELASLPIDECWSGLRPTTPDKMPILGRTPWSNLFVAGGYWRNGVLLAPKTGQIIGDLLLNNCSLSSEDEELLEAFSWERFVSKEGGLKMAVTSRIAAATYPTQHRAKGFGISASVGTELGFYSGASSAVDERKKDRDDDDDDEALEAAARLGISDASLFDYATADQPSSLSDASSTSYEKPVSNSVDDGIFLDAYTVGSSEQHQATSSGNADDIASIYDQIAQNKANSGDVQMGETNSNRPNPGFRIHHINIATQEMTPIPPYTRPEAFLASSGKFGTLSEGFSADEYSEETYDGYADIEKANGAEGREGELASMKRARLANRDSESEIDMSIIGAQRIEGIADDAYIQVNSHTSSDIAQPFGGSSSYLSSISNKPSAKGDDLTLNAYTFGSANKAKNNKDITKPENPLRLYSENDMASIYERISQNKANSLQGTGAQMGEISARGDLPDPGFRIHHVNIAKQEMTLIPPYTRPEAFLANIGKFGTLSEGFSADEYSEETYDGYSEIEKANGAESREAELALMKKARQANRDSASGIDISKIGAQRLEGNPDDSYL